MHSRENTDATADADGFFPWCLKSIDGAENVAPHRNPTHIYYKKDKCPGKIQYIQRMNIPK